MTKCPQCGKEFEGTETCPECGTKVHVQKPNRPIGITIVAILCFLGAAMSVWAMFGDNPALFLGMFLPTIAATAFNALVAAINVYLGIGLLGLKPMARTVYIYFSIFGILNAISNIFRLDDLVQIAADAAAKKSGGVAVPDTSVFSISIMVGITVTILLGAFLLYYVYKKKDLFVK